MAGLGVSTADNNRVCVIMVGLPATGKTMMAQKIVRYLSWLSIPSKCFNIGLYRRRKMANPSSKFFEKSNAEGDIQRREATQAALQEMIEWFTDPDSQGLVGVFDATNTTKIRREWLVRILKEYQIQPMFVESIVNDAEIISTNINDIQSNSPDYKDLDPTEAFEDLKQKVLNYEVIYEPLDEVSDKDLTFVKIINFNTQSIVNKICSYLQSRIVYYLLNLHVKPRSIWLSRHGESMYNLSGQLGGDADLSPGGQLYAAKLPSLVLDSVGDRPLTIWTSTLKRTQQTSRFLQYRQLQWKALDELDAGVCDGMTYAEIEEKYPEDFKARDDNKFEYRYKGGESYRDVVSRLEPIIMELERQENIMIVTHQAVLRCLYAYFMNVDMSESPWMEVPLHTLIKLDVRAYGTTVTRIKADIPAVSTYREKGSKA
ncbi:bifunctional 6-phosphofructo-2-kinase/fructose-2,6-bisphosphate 2-phosphatase [Nadsonia fulvescens var. elongata DSM 6958]|uniref:fructose-2,6-bisphosphate 2-phosphatase n=1 Tax=Nadsonia fulvescens var. elongata DSM 6958 TaxID=857566 RepID=A0A1E3PQF2_9ASCO|nr:bifunctional 6-phosphofructo-2-kinase/fructose-2,6-bisphosphate 2-phosphatase [Nadsonia fulvescens var. elongata DSM 6958]